MRSSERNTRCDTCERSRTVQVKQPRTSMWGRSVMRGEEEKQEDGVSAEKVTLNHQKQCPRSCAESRGRPGAGPPRDCAPGTGRLANQRL